MDDDKSEEKSADDDWIKLHSKSRQGRSYMFNKATGESYWCKESTKKPQTPPISTKKLHTPAQDRLKRLQTDLKNRLKEKNINQIDKSAEHLLTKNCNINKHYEKKHLQKNEKLTTTNSAITAKRSTRKRQATKSNSRETSVEPVKHKKSTNAGTADIEMPTTSSVVDACANIGNGFVNKVKEIWRSTFSSKEKMVSKKSKDLKNKEIEKIIKHHKKKSKITEKNVESNVKPTETANRPGRHSNFNTGASAASEVYRGKANERLQRLRKSLQMQQRNTASKTADYDEPTSTSFFSKSKESTNNRFDEKSNSFNNTTENKNSEAENGFESMDWESIDSDDFEKTNIETIKKNLNVSSVCVKEKSKSRVAMKFDQNISQTYEVVNKNLMRYAAEQKHKANNAVNWLMDHIYFILDTNILLKNLTFLDDLIQMRLCDTKGTVLYIPYIVLQELDKLKHNSSSEGTKLLAGRAIRYLNAKFEAKSKHVQAQSALEEGQHLIKIDSPDDSIINCCLQVKQHIENNVLLTDDINLQNKAMSNDIIVTTKSDLTSFHAEMRNTKNNTKHNNTA